MAAAFVFEPPSDEEYSDAEEQQPQEEEEEDEQEEDEAALKPSRASRHSESPWDFASYSETVAQEHARRSTTSVDFKISKALQQRSVPSAVAHDDDGSSESQSESEPESDKQVCVLLILLKFIQSIQCV